MEEWKDIPGYEHLYQASTHGRIRTCEGKVTKSARFEHRVWKQRIMKQKYQKRKGGKGKKDARVCLWKDGHEQTLLVARLVAMTWCAGYEEGLTVNHIDGDPMNNHCENLEWVSHTENIRLAYQNDLYTQRRRTTLISPSGEVLHFKSMADAGRYLGHTGLYIGHRIRQGYTTTPSGYRIEVETP